MKNATLLRIACKINSLLCDFAPKRMIMQSHRYAGHETRHYCGVLYEYACEA